MILGKWTAKNVIVNEINYINGIIKNNQWNITLNFISKINNQYVTKVIFQNSLNHNDTGFEFCLFNFNDDNKSINGIDSNSIYDGYLKDNILLISNRGFDHIKFDNNQYITSYNAEFHREN